MSAHVTTPNLASKPYVVVRDKATLTFNRGAGAADFVPFLFGSWFDNDVDKHLAPAYAIFGNGGANPAVAATAINAVNITNTLRARARLHRLAVRVSNTGSTGASSVPDGKFWLGTLRGTADHKGFATYGDLAFWLLGRNEAVEYTAYNAFTLPRNAVCSPGDFIEYESFNTVGSNATPLNHVVDHSLNQVFLVIGPSSNAQNYEIQIDAEWTMEYQSDPVLQSLHRTHTATPESTWNSVKTFVANHGGVLEEVAGAAAVGAAATLGAPELAGALLGREAGVAGIAQFGGRAAARRAVGWAPGLR